MRGRHFYTFDTNSDTYLFLPDYRSPENQIEFFSDGIETISYQEFITDIDDSIATNDPAFLGDFTFEELQNDPNIPEDARVDFAALGLSPGSIDEDLQEIADTNQSFEDTITNLTANGDISSSLSDEDRSYIHEDETFFYDFYSLPIENEIEPGDIVKLDISSSDFEPILFVLDSKGNVLDYESAEGETSTELTIGVGSGEPLFVSVESRDSNETGDYTLSVETVNRDRSTIAPSAFDSSTYLIDSIESGDTVTSSRSAITGSPYYRYRYISLS